MSDYQYARKRPDLSWHPVHSGTLDTVCGHRVVAPSVEVPPWEGKTCESGLRIITRKREQALQRAKPNTDEDTEHEVFDDDPSVGQVDPT